MSILVLNDSASRELRGDCPAGHFRLNVNRGSNPFPYIGESQSPTKMGMVETYNNRRQNLIYIKARISWFQWRQVFTWHNLYPFSCKILNVSIVSGTRFNPESQNHVSTINVRSLIFSWWDMFTHVRRVKNMQLQTRGEVWSGQPHTTFASHWGVSAPHHRRSLTLVERAVGRGWKKVYFMQETCNDEKRSFHK